MTDRRKPNRRQLDRLAAYYGFKCVVTGNEAYEWHHLDDDPSNTVDENLIPISGNLNLELRDLAEQARKGSLVIPIATLEPHYLANHADSCARVWRLGAAYGAARLGCFVAINCTKEPIDFAVTLACQAVWCARHRLNYLFIADTFKRSLLPLLAKGTRISKQTHFGVIREAAGIYAEHGRCIDALELYQKVDAASGVSQGDQAALLRRQATTSGALTGLNNRTKALFDDASRMNPGDLNLSASVANSLAWLLIGEGRFYEALDVLEPVVAKLRRRIFRPGREPIPVGMTVWNAAEVFLNYAVAISGARPARFKEKRKQAVDDAAKLFALSKAAFYEIRIGASEKSTALLEGTLSHSVTRKLPKDLERLMRETIKALGKTSS